MEAATLKALADPAFLSCLRAAAANKELVENFDRLAGANLSMRGTGLDVAIDAASGRQDTELGRFADFIRDTIYERLEPAALQALR